MDLGRHKQRKIERYADGEPDGAPVRTPGKRTLTEELAAPAAPVQRRAGGGIQLPEGFGAGAVAAAGVGGTGGELPHRGAIEAAFGVPVSARAHTGPQATQACEALGAEAYTFDGAIAFRSASPSRELVAHEAAHVVQQHSGRKPAAGVSQPDDLHEREAEVVAAAVGRGESAAGLLAHHGGVAGGAAAGTGAIQRQVVGGQPAAGGGATPAAGGGQPAAGGGSHRAAIERELPHLQAGQTDGLRSYLGGLPQHGAPAIPALIDVLGTLSGTENLQRRRNLRRAITEHGEANADFRAALDSEIDTRLARLRPAAQAALGSDSEVADPAATGATLSATAPLPAELEGGAVPRAPAGPARHAGVWHEYREAVILYGIALWAARSEAELTRHTAPGRANPRRDSYRRFRISALARYVEARRRVFSARANARGALREIGTLSWLTESDHDPTMAATSELTGYNDVQVNRGVGALSVLNNRNNADALVRYQRYRDGGRGVAPPTSPESVLEHELTRIRTRATEEAAAPAPAPARRGATPGRAPARPGHPAAPPDPEARAAAARPRLQALDSVIQERDRELAPYLGAIGGDQALITEAARQAIWGAAMDALVRGVRTVDPAFRFVLMSTPGMLGHIGISMEGNIESALNRRAEQGRVRAGIGGVGAIGTYTNHGAGQYDIHCQLNAPVFVVAPPDVDLGVVLAAQAGNQPGAAARGGPAAGGSPAAATSAPDPAAVHAAAGSAPAVEPSEPPVLADIPTGGAPNDDPEGDAALRAPATGAAPTSAAPTGAAPTGAAPTGAAAPAARAPGASGPSIYHHVSSAAGQHAESAQNADVLAKLIHGLIGRSVDNAAVRAFAEGTAGAPPVHVDPDRLLAALYWNDSVRGGDVPPACEPARRVARATIHRLMRAEFMAAVPSVAVGRGASARTVTINWASVPEDEALTPVSLGATARAGENPGTPDAPVSVRGETGRGTLGLPASITSQLASLPPDQRTQAIDQIRRAGARAFIHVTADIAHHPEVLRDLRGVMQAAIRAEPATGGLYHIGGSWAIVEHTYHNDAGERASIQVYYAHLSSVNGSYGSAGSYLGRAGTSGNAVSPHVHMFIRATTPHGAGYLNPTQFFEFTPLRRH